jgi:ATP-dependent DNA helicase Rep/DNA helicase-2/ATP-dependent DNA helicase PcrA
LGRWGIKQALDEEAEDAIALQKKTENVEELCNSLGMIQIEADELAEDSHADAVLRIYLQRVLLDALEEEERDQEQKEKEQKNQVTLLTLHGSKGLEYEMVFLVGCEEGLLPHQRTLDAVQDLSEERRLCYVGMTRAKNHLVMTRTKNRIRYGKRVPRIPSRFLDEIPKELVILQDESLSPEIASKELEEAHEAKVKDFLAGIRASLQKN